MTRNLLAAALALASLSAQAGLHCNTPDCPPDTWGGYKAHLTYSGAIGAGSELIVPPIAQWAGMGPKSAQTLAFGLCLVPGTVREWRSRSQPGNRFSNRDMLSNAAGCGIGMGTVAGVRWALTADPVTTAVSVGLRIELP
jgi:hypothetical protein